MKFNSLYCFEYKDMYNIYTKIKRINKHYKLYYNIKDKCFLIINTANFNEICLNFSSFNLNVEKLLNFSNVKNFEKVIKYIEQSNYQTEEKKVTLAKEKTLTACNECRNLLNRTSKISTHEIDKIIGEGNA